MNPIMDYAGLPANKGEFTTYELDPTQPLRLVRDLTSHAVDDVWLWIGIEDGVLVILTDEESRRFQGLIRGQSPATLLAECCGATADPDQIKSEWLKVSILITKLAKAGFISGIEGHHDIRELNPERFARLHITRRCQLRCIHCYATSGPELDARGEWPTRCWLRLIDDIADAGGYSVLFTGGEPLLRPDCPQLMRHANSRGLQVVLFSNGLLVEKRLSEFADSVDLVQLSLNGPDQASNDAIRGAGTFHRVVGAIELLLQARVPVRVGMTVMEQNWHAFQTGFLEFAAKYKGTPLKFHLGYGLCHYGRATMLEDHLDLEEIRPVLDQYLAATGQLGDGRITRKTTGCGYGEQLVVASDGVVYPCHLLDGSLGHIDERPLLQWYALLRRIAQDHHVERLIGCRDCDLRHLCGGTCRVVNERTRGSKFISTCSEADRAIRYRNLVRLFQFSEPGVPRPD